ncbi:hypothetical protein Ciccas_007900 [Cichlidogyrus casuarinus]|uniref:Uncharacterized protein n=1 Tax=Cichlidogyrus casuarinus TaxID=1844966 RepID=A0ABD2Q1Y6_9PLAT
MQVQLTEGTNQTERLPTVSVQCETSYNDSHSQVHVPQAVDCLSAILRTCDERSVQGQVENSSVEFASQCQPRCTDLQCQTVTKKRPQLRDALAYSFETQVLIDTASTYAIKTMNQSSVAVRPVSEASVATRTGTNVKHIANQMEHLGPHSLEKSVLALAQAIDEFTNTACSATEEVSLQTTEVLTCSTLEFASQCSPAIVEHVAASVSCKPKCRDSHCQMQIPKSDKTCNTELPKKEICHLGLSCASTLFSPDKSDEWCQTKLLHRVKDASVNGLEIALQNTSSQTQENQIETSSNYIVGVKEGTTTVGSRKLGDDVSVQAKCGMFLLEAYVESSPQCMVDSIDQATHTLLKDVLVSSPGTATMEKLTQRGSFTCPISTQTQFNPKPIREFASQYDPHCQTKRNQTAQTTSKSLRDCYSQYDSIGSIDCQISVQPCVDESCIQTEVEATLIDCLSIYSRDVAASQTSTSQSEAQSTRSVALQGKPKCRDSHCQVVTKSMNLSDKSVAAVTHTKDVSIYTVTENPCVEELCTQTEMQMETMDCFSAYGSRNTCSVASQEKSKCRDSHCQVLFERERKDASEMISQMATESSMPQISVKAIEFKKIVLYKYSCKEL